MKYLLSIVLLALIGVTTPKKTTPAYDWGSVSAKPDLSWADQVGAQRTPKNTEWDAGKFGLRNDTSVFSTPAIQAAIDACHQQGGGTVVVAPGYYKIGALFIKSGVNLHLSKGTTLLASDNIQDYPEFPSRIAGIEMTWPSAVINIMGKALSIAAEKYSGINIGRCGRNMRRRICAGLWIMIASG